MSEYNDSYFLDKAGFALVMNEKTGGSFYCLDIFGTEVVVDDKDACASLFSMVGEDVINIDENDKFSLSEPFNGMCNVMANADKILAVYLNGRYNNCTAFYITDEKVTVVQNAPNRKNILKVSEEDRNGIFDYINENILTKLNRKKKAKEKTLFLESLEFLAVNDNFDHIIDDSDTYMFIELFIPDKKLNLLKAGLIGNEEEIKLCIWDDSGFKIDNYSPEKLKMLIDEI